MFCFLKNFSLHCYSSDDNFIVHHAYVTQLESFTSQQQRKGFFAPKEFSVPKLKGTAFIQANPLVTSSGVEQGNLGTLVVERIHCVCYTSGHGSESGESLKCVAKVDMTVRGGWGRGACKQCPRRQNQESGQDGSTLVTLP